MKTMCLGKPPAALQLGRLAWVCVLVMGLGALSARAAEQGRPATPRDPQGPRFLEVPAGLSQPPAAAAPAPAPAPIPPAKPEPGPVNGPPDTGKTLYAFKAEDLELRTALAQFARANHLNIVPDHDVVGTVTVDLHDLPLEQVMRALLEAADCSWREEGGLIRVRNSETRTFPVNYLRLTRTGFGASSAQLGSGGTVSGTGGGTGMGMGGGMGPGAMGGAPAGGQGAGGNQGTVSYGTSLVNVYAQNAIEFWNELRKELESMLTEQGKRSLAMNMTAGLVQVTDRPSALKKVEDYLSGVDKSIHRQVDIETRLYSVTLNNQFQFGIDWVHVAEAYGGLLGFGGATLPEAIGGTSLQDSSLRGIGANSPSTLVFRNFNTEVAVNALAQQGKVEVISKPRVRTLNNQTALIKVGEDKPFFNSSTIYLPVANEASTTTLTPSSQTVVNQVTIGTILSVTPQISEDGWISLDIAPVLTSLIGTVFAPASGGLTNGVTTSGTTAPDLETKQASSLVRVRDGSTVVLGGLIQTQAAKNLRKVPLLGDIPLLGKLFTGTFEFKQKQELVIFVTPHIVPEEELSAKVTPDEQSRNYRLIEPRTDHPARVLEGVQGPQWPQVAR